MKVELGKKYIVTTDGWFYAPDGNTYRAVYGTVHAIQDDNESLGIKTNDRSTNWYIVIGAMIVAGCQIHYAIKTDEVNFNPSLREIEHGGLLNVTEQVTRIYNADESYTVTSHDADGAGHGQLKNT